MTTSTAATPAHPETSTGTNNVENPTDHPHTHRYHEVLHDLATATTDLQDFAAKHKMTRVQMSRWVDKPRHRTMIDDLTRLAERREELLIATGRADAVKMLIRIANNEEPGARDITRKACLDLLKLSRVASAPRPAAAARAGADEPIDLDAEMAALEKQAEIDAKADMALEFDDEQDENSTGGADFF